MLAICIRIWIFTVFFERMTVTIAKIIVIAVGLSPVAWLSIGLLFGDLGVSAVDIITSTTGK